MRAFLLFATHLESSKSVKDYTVDPKAVA